MTSAKQGRYIAQPVSEGQPKTADSREKENRRHMAAEAELNYLNG
jgi:hypothetical protein